MTAVTMIMTWQSFSFALLWLGHMLLFQFVFQMLAAILMPLMLLCQVGYIEEALREIWIWNWASSTMYKLLMDRAIGAIEL